MLATVFTKGIRDRWVGTTVAAGALVTWLLVAMAAYRDIDIGFYTDMPEIFRSLMNIPDDADIGALAYGMMFGFAGAVTLAGLAVSMGAASIAGEERDGTLGLLLGNPKSRAHVLVSKAAAMMMLIALATLVLWGAAEAIPRLLDVSIGGMAIGAGLLHLYVNALFYGFGAMLIGAWTGDRSRASGIAAGVMAVSYVAVGILPLIDAASGAARFFPWYYFDSSDPVVNGIEWGHLGVLGGCSIAFAVAAVVGVDRRDLRDRAGGVTLVDRLRSNPLTEKVVEKLAGSARVSSIWTKTASDHQGVLIITAYVMFLMMGVVMGPLYTFIDESLREFAAQLPEVFLDLFGGGDLSTAEGFYEVETFSIMGPIAVILVAAAVGSRALAGEEERRTMALLLANPVRRSAVVLVKAAVMVGFAAVVGLFTFGGVALGSVIAGLGMSLLNIAAVSVQMTLVGLVFGAVSLALGAATGRVRVAVAGTVGLALTFYLLNSLLQLDAATAGWAKWSPFYYYLSADPLTRGMPWGHAGVLAAITAVLIGASVVLFERRDLRQAG